MTTHTLHRERTRDSIIGDCSCGRFYMESHGNDESSRAAVAYRFERHVEEVAA